MNDDERGGKDAYDDHTDKVDRLWTDQTTDAATSTEHFKAGCMRCMSCGKGSRARGRADAQQRGEDRATRAALSAKLAQQRNLLAQANQHDCMSSGLGDDPRTRKATYKSTEEPATHAASAAPGCARTWRLPTASNCPPPSLHLVCTPCTYMSTCRLHSRRNVPVHEIRGWTLKFHEISAGEISVADFRATT